MPRGLRLGPGPDLNPAVGPATHGLAQNIMLFAASLLFRAVRTQSEE